MKSNHGERCCPASFRVIAVERWPASVWILRPQEHIDRVITSGSLTVMQRHQRIASRFNPSSAAISTHPSSARQTARFNLGLNVSEKAHKRNEVFRTENLSKNPHTH